MANTKIRPPKEMPVSAYHAAQDPIAELGNIRDPRDARAFLDMSLSQITILIPNTTSSNHNHAAPSTYSDWESGRRTPHIEQVRVIETLLSDSITREMAYDKMQDEPERRFIIRIDVGQSRWTVKAFTTCTKCKKLYHITRRDSRRCKRCIGKSKR